MEHVSVMEWAEMRLQFLITILALVVLDFVVMSTYVTKGFSSTMMRYYGAKIAVHTAAGMTLLAVGVAGLAASLPADLAYSLPFGCWLDVVRVCEIVLGTAVVVAGCTSLALARYTSGYEGYNWAGYSLYTLLWISSGLRLFAPPGSSARPRADPLELSTSSGREMYVCFVVSHAFLFCRIFTVGLKPLGLGFKMTYAVGTAVATLVTLVIAYGKWGAQAWGASNVACLLVQLSGAGDWIHARGVRAIAGKSKKKTSGEEFPSGGSVCMFATAQLPAGGGQCRRHLKDAPARRQRACSDVQKHQEEEEEELEAYSAGSISTLRLRAASADAISNLRLRDALAALVPLSQ